MMALGLLAMAEAAPARSPLLLHVMPWFERSGDRLGWHWTMNRPAAELLKAGRVASHFRPLIGPYDSADPAVLELQVAWMKLAGFDGVLADWYGVLDAFDYPMIHTRTLALFDVAERAGLKIGVVFEDQTAKHAVREGKLKEDEVPALAERTGRFLRETWFPRKGWLKLKGQPAVFVFGPQRFGPADWDRFRMGTGPMQLLTLHHRPPVADGVYDWPLPHVGLGAQEEFARRTASEPIRVAVAYPRFRDWYEEGGQTGYPDLPDDEGRTYSRLLTEGLKGRFDAVQVATWNDWQEGTQIEPSVELGLRDLIATQRARRAADPSFRFTPADLELPLKAYRLRTRQPALASRASALLLKGDLSAARTLLK